MALLSVFTFLNFLGLVYLTFIVYRKIVSVSKSPRSISPDTSPAPGANELARIPECIQKMAIIRFNPFDDLGGDQSFVLAILNQHHDGFVITSLHNRDSTRVYAKPIKNGQGDNITLSQEEKNAILKAIKG